MEFQFYLPKLPVLTTVPAVLSAVSAPNTGGGQAMQAAFARKLGMTAGVLRCATRKELCARFRAVNPQTEFDLERSFKWLQGKALPRSAAVYDDWAAVLGTARAGSWLAASSVDAFADEVAALFSVDRMELQALSDRFLGAVLVRQLAEDGLAGAYLCYSQAWSPFHAGRLIRGVMDLQAGTRGGFLAQYQENLPSGPWTGRGLGRRSGRVLTVALEGTVEEHLTLSLLVPGRPVNVLGGRMQGTTIHGAETQLCATRIVLLRTGPGQAEAPECFVPQDAASLAADLRLRGRNTETAGDLAEAMLRFLLPPTGPASAPISPGDLNALVGLTLRD